MDMNEDDKKLAEVTALIVGLVFVLLVIPSYLIGYMYILCLLTLLGVGFLVAVVVLICMFMAELVIDYYDD